MGETRRTACMTGARRLTLAAIPAVQARSQHNTQGVTMPGTQPNPSTTEHAEQQQNGQINFSVFGAVQGIATNTSAVPIPAEMRTGFGQLATYFSALPNTARQTFTFPPEAKNGKTVMTERGGSKVPSNKPARTFVKQMRAWAEQTGHGISVNALNGAHTVTFRIYKKSSKPANGPVTVTRIPVQSPAPSPATVAAASK